MIPEGGPSGYGVVPLLAADFIDLLSRVDRSAQSRGAAQWLREPRGGFFVDLLPTGYIDLLFRFASSLLSSYFLPLFAGSSVVIVIARSLDPSFPLTAEPRVQTGETVT